MPFVPVANTVLAEIRMLLDGQNVENTLYFEFPTPPSLANLLALGAILSDWWAVNIAPICSNQVQLREVALTDLTSATGPVGAVIPTTALFGDVTAGSLPNNVTLAISFRTGMRGRSFRGRNYFVGLTESQVVQNTVDGATVTELQNAYAQLKSDIEDGGWTWVVVSRFSGVDVDGDPIPRVAGVTTPIVLAVVTDDTVDSQRGRLPGRGT